MNNKQSYNKIMTYIIEQQLDKDDLAQLISILSTSFTLILKEIIGEEKTALMVLAAMHDEGLEKSFADTLEILIKE